jgi:hypothetical protein
MQRGPAVVLHKENSQSLQEYWLFWQDMKFTLPDVDGNVLLVWSQNEFHNVPGVRDVYEEELMFILECFQHNMYFERRSTRLSDAIVREYHRTK